MSSQIVSVFTTYQKARLAFAQQIADLSARPQNLLFLQNANVLALLKPLLKDSVPAVQQIACLALSRLANSKELAKEIVSLEIIPLLVVSLKSSARILYSSMSSSKTDSAKEITRSTSSAAKLALQSSRHLKKACACVIRSVARHEEELANAVTNFGAVDALNNCLEEFDPQVKEAAVLALGLIGTHSEDLAQKLKDMGSLGLLVLCLQEPELALKRASISSITEIVKHSIQLAQALIDTNSLNLVAKLLNHNDSRTRRLSANLLAQVSKHSVDLAEVVVDLEVIPQSLVLLQDDDPYVRKASATLVREICKHSVELSRLVVNGGGIAALIDLISSGPPGSRSSGKLELGPCSTKLPAIMCIGYMAAFSETLAASIIAAKCLEALKPFLAIPESPDDGYLDEAEEKHPTVDGSRSRVIQVDDEHYVAAAVWTVGQIGRHSPSHAEACCVNDLPRFLLKIYFEDSLCDDLRSKSKTALNSILEKTTHLPVLQQLLSLAAVKSRLKVVKIVLRQLAKVLPNDKDGKREFIQSGSLQLVQELESKLIEEQLGEVKGEIDEINQCFPPAIVQYYSPKHAEELMKLMEDEELDNIETKN
eukprot:augustus_masked-scaffold_3-processed-gene-15.3-mRNA-1 protein AED:0.00 eAED:0.04 QI:0/-1/0/1/-1/1/1/0/593